MKKKASVIILAVIAAVAGMIAVIYGVYTKIKGSLSISLIGGADGPTSIFLAGKLNSGFSMIFIIAGVIVLAFVLFLLLKKRK